MKIFALIILLVLLVTALAVIFVLAGLMMINRKFVSTSNSPIRAATY